MEGGEDVFRWSGFNQIVRQSYLMKIGIACRARCVYDNPSVRPAPGLAGRICPMKQMLRVPPEEKSLRPRTTQTPRPALPHGVFSRSGEHTPELPSPCNIVLRLLLLK